MKPEPMTDEQMLHELVLLDAETKRLPPGFKMYAKSIAYLRDKQWEELLSKQEPDAYCVTAPDGACVSTDPRCMHQPAEPVNQQLLDALKSLYGPLNDPKVGWRGRTHDNPEEFQCEYCKAVNLDCSQIHHAETCPTVLAQAAIAAAEKELK